MDELKLVILSIIIDKGDKNYIIPNINNLQLENKGEIKNSF